MTQYQSWSVSVTRCCSAGFWDVPGRRHSLPADSVPELVGECDLLLFRWVLGCAGVAGGTNCLH